MDSVASLIITLLTALQVLIVVRIVMSYFPNASYSGAGRLVARIVDPVLAPFRRLLPTFGGLDFSPMLAIGVIWVLQRLVASSQTGTVDASTSIKLVIVDLLLGIMGIFCLLVAVRVVMSLFHASRFHPMVQFVFEVTNPLVRPFADLGSRRPGLDIPALVALGVYGAVFIVARILLYQFV